MADYTRKTTAIGHDFTATLSDASGPVDLPNGTSVQFVARLFGGAADAIRGDGVVVAPGADVTSPDRGAVRYTPVAADLATPGLYDCQWEVTLPGGTPQPFPEDGFLTLLVLPDL